MRWCAACILPDTRPNLVLGDDGVCQACATHGRRSDVDWEARAKAFEGVVAAAQARTHGYDCVIPVSGGKDSTWQVVRCLEHGMRPLAVTWRPPARTPIGQANLDNLVSLGVDHIDWSIDPHVERRFLTKALVRFGAAAIPMHMAMFSIPLAVAVRFGIPLIVWGENSAVEYAGEEDTTSGHQLDEAWLRRFGVTHGTTAHDWVDDELTERDLAPYFPPSASEVESAGVQAIFLGHYFAWDPETTARVAAEHGFRSTEGGARTGLYDYADIDDEFISVHHFFKWHKFGFTRLFDNLSLEIRNGRMIRDDAIEVVRARGLDVPVDDIESFCRFVGMPVERFHEIAEQHRNLDVFTLRDGRWVIDDFLVPDWDWERT